MRCAKWLDDFSREEEQQLIRDRRVHLNPKPKAATAVLLPETLSGCCRFCCRAGSRVKDWRRVGVRETGGGRSNARSKKRRSGGRKMKVSLRFGLWKLLRCASPAVFGRRNTNRERSAKTLMEGGEGSSQGVPGGRISATGQAHVGRGAPSGGLPYYVPEQLFAPTHEK